MFNLIGFCIAMFIAYRLWQKNKFWRNITAYILLPIGFIYGIISINQYDYVGEFMIIEIIIYIILLAKTWNEFGDEIKSMEEE